MPAATPSCGRARSSRDRGKLHETLKEVRDDLVSDCHRSDLQEMSRIQRLPPERRHRRLQEAGRNAEEARRSAARRRAAEGGLRCTRSWSCWEASFCSSSGGSSRSRNAEIEEAQATSGVQRL